MHTLDIVPLRSESPPQKCSGMARVLKGFHSFTCTPTRLSAIGMSHTCLCLPSRSLHIYSFAHRTFCTRSAPFRYSPPGTKFKVAPLHHPWLRLCSLTRSSADADNRLDAFSGQSRSTNMVPFHM